MEINPRTPVLIGVGQITERPSSGATFASRSTPLSLMVQALEKAAGDSGAPGALEAIDEIVAIGSFTWHTNDPARLVVEQLGLNDVVTRLTPTGGNLPQMLVHESARRILNGEVTTVCVVGSEANYARGLARKEGVDPEWVKQGDEVAKPPFVEDNRIPFTKDEYEQGLTLPVEVYPVFENARRARMGWSMDDQAKQLGRLWANFAKVAKDNPYAWITEPPAPAAITTATKNNRMVSFPYTKFLVANLPVDMGAAFIMTSYEKAVSLGVAKDKMIFPQCGADANDHWFVSERPVFDDSPAMRALWSSLQNFGVTSDEIAHIDLYSCFPTVVQTACEVMGIDPLDEQRIPTLTGGLTFGGGPGNNYVTHSICSMVDKLRSNPSSHGLVTGLGWFSTKHAWGTYSSTPPKNAFQWRSAQPDVDAQEKCVFEQRSGEVTIESYTVVHLKDGAPSKLVVAARSSDGVRSWSHSTDEALMELSETQEIIGRSAIVEEDVISLS